MKYFIYPLMSLFIVACSSKSGMEEKDLATEAFIDCNFSEAIAKSEEALEYAGDNVEVAVPALLIIGKSSEFLDQASTAYEDIVMMAPGIATAGEAKEIANQFVQSLSSMAPEKVKACPMLQR